MKIPPWTSPSYDPSRNFGRIGSPSHVFRLRDVPLQRGPSGILSVTVGVGIRLLISFDTASCPYTHTLSLCICLFGFHIPPDPWGLVPAASLHGARLLSPKRTERVGRGQKLSFLYRLDRPACLAWLEQPSRVGTGVKLRQCCPSQLRGLSHCFTKGRAC